jgi:hypothetical protein
LNTTALGKLYDRLTPAERLPLIIAASRRGDETERQRLAQAAPRTDLRVPDYYALGLALQESATFHIVDLLNLAAQFWQAWGLWGWFQSLPQRPEEEALKMGLVKSCAYEFTVHDAAWGLFCAEQRMEPEALLDFMPGYERIEMTRNEVRGLAYTHEEATMFLRLHGKPTAVAAMEEDVLKSLRELLKAREAWWNGDSA